MYHRCFYDQRGPERLFQTLVLVCLCFLWPVACPGQDAGSVAGTVDETVQTRQGTQQRLDGWSQEKAELLGRYRLAKAQVDWLQARKLDLTAEADALAARVAELQRRLAEADRLNTSIQDTLQVIMRRLGDSVEQSLPFLPEERRLRIAAITAELARPDIEPADKLRRLLEALQVEAGYAATVEVYQDRIEVGGQSLHADILRLGRLALFWRTPDTERAGLYDQATDSWQELSGSYRRKLNLAMEMALRQRPVDLVELPLGRVAP